MSTTAEHPVGPRRGRRRALMLGAGLLVPLVAASAAVWFSTGAVGGLDRLVALRLRPEGARPVPFGAIAPVLRKATVATEDERFWKHSGIDFIGILRAVPYDVSHASAAQGASTITEQLAKTLYLGGDDHSIVRKARDAALALRLEQRYGKRQILDAYLNSVYFGHGAIGIGPASHAYFGTVPARLSLAQASMLAGLIQAPSSLDPYHYPQAARERQVEVLRGMVRTHAISAREGVAALDQPLPLARARALPPLHYTGGLAPGPVVDAREIVFFAALAGALVLILLMRRRRPGPGRPRPRPRSAV